MSMSSGLENRRSIPKAGPGRSKICSTRYTRLPDKSASLRRRQRISAISDRLTAYDLGLADQPPFTPKDRKFHLDEDFQTPTALKVSILDTPSSLSLSDLSIPRDRMSESDCARRERFRHVAIFDGEQFSPTSRHHFSLSHENPPSSAQSTPTVPPRISSLKQLPPLTEHPNPLALVFSLFDLGRDDIRSRPGLTSKDVERAMSDVVEREVERLASQGAPLLRELRRMEGRKSAWPGLSSRPGRWYA